MATPEEQRAAGVASFYDDDNWGAGFKQVDKAHPNGHNGFDVKGHKQGTWIPAVLAGTVVYKGFDSIYGNVTTIKTRLANGTDVWLYYCHKVNDSGPGVGASVAWGEGVGPVGTTGVSTGPHLHLGASNVGDRPANYRGLIDPKPFVVGALTRAAGGGVEPIPTPNTGEDRMNITRRPSNGTIAFADELGNEPILNYISSDIGTAEYVNAVAKLAPSIANLTDREFDIISAVVARRVAAYNAKIAAATTAQVLAAIKGGITVNADVDEAAIVKGLTLTLGPLIEQAAGNLSDDELKAIAKAVSDEAARRLVA